MEIPRVLTSDQGSEFNNAINRDLMTLLQNQTQTYYCISSTGDHTLPGT